MKKLVTMLAFVGILASCAKETPVVPVGQQNQNEQGALQEAPVDLRDSDPNSGGVRYTFAAEVAPLELSSVGFDGTPAQNQEARAIQTIFGGGNRENGKAKFISYGLDPKTPQFTIKGYLYEIGGESDSFIATAVADPSGKSLSFSLPENKIPRRGRLRRLVDAAKQPGRKIQLALFVNFNKSQNDATQETFDNKGAYLVKYEQGKTIQLPDNFVVLKSLGNPVEWSNGMLRVKSGHKVKLTTQGYLLAVRFRNHAYPKVVKHTWDSPDKDPYPSDMGGRPVSDRNRIMVKRPDLRLHLRISGLSSNYQVEFAFKPQEQRFETIPVIVGTGASQKKFNTPGFTTFPGSGTGSSLGTDKEFQITFQNTNSSIFRVPVEEGVRASGQDDVNTEAINKTPLRQGEPIALIYCPQPNDDGHIWYMASDDLFYDQSNFSLSIDRGERYYTVYGTLPKIRKEAGRRWNGAGSLGYEGYQADGKVFLPVFHIIPPKTALKGTPTGNKPYDSAASKKIRWEKYKERNEEAKP